jgi:CBS domain containing-hemolysin-like protein
MIPLALFLLGCAGVYLGTVEAAFELLMRLSLRLLAERGSRRADLGRYLEDPVLLFLPVRLMLWMVVATATVLVSIVAGGSALHVIGVAVLGTIAAVVVCVHLVPLLIVRRNPERVLEVLLPSFTVLAQLLRPVTGPLIRLVASRRDRSNGQPVSGDSGDDAAEAASAYLDAGEQEGLIERDERRLLQSIVDFGDTLVREVMTPRPDIVAIPAGATLPELRTLLREQGYSRVPVFKDNLDNILGFVFVKDVIQVQDEGAQPGAVAALMRPAYFVPETKRVSDLLKEFQRQQRQIAIVVDEYGGTAGVVTLEDLLEEIVGEIRDEYDRESEAIVDEGGETFLVSGKAGIDQVSERLGVTVEREGFDTIGGWVLSRLGRVPAVGETFEIDGLGVEVVDAERRRVHKIRIRCLPRPAVDSEPS